MFNLCRRRITKRLELEQELHRIEIERVKDKTMLETIRLITDNGSVVYNKHTGYGSGMKIPVDPGDDQSIRDAIALVVQS